MKNVYACPHCEAVLNPSVKILLKVGYKGKQGMILLSPQPGNFKFICDRTVADALQDGKAATFACPVCGQDLQSPQNKEFVRLHLVGPDRKIRKVEFSRVFGQHATFVVDEDEITSYGEDVSGSDPTNFFGV